MSEHCGVSSKELAAGPALYVLGWVYRRVLLAHQYQPLALVSGHLTYFTKLCSAIVMFSAAAAHMVVRTYLVMIEQVFLAPEIQLTVFANPMFLGVCPMTLCSFIRYEKSIAATAPCVAFRVSPMAL